MSYNPVKNAFHNQTLYGSEHTMTISGTLHKIAYLFASLGVGAGLGIYLTAIQSPYTMLAFWAAFIGAFICGIITVFSPQQARYTSLFYAFGQGVTLSIISQAFEAYYPGIVVTAVSLSGATALAMYLLYSFKIIEVTEQLRSVIISATAGIALTYSIVFLLWIFGVNVAPFYQSGGTMSILFSLFVVGIAAFNLLLDFDLIEKGSDHGLPQYMEWYAAFSLLVTLIWLYLEILRLLSKLNNRKK